MDAKTQKKNLIMFPVGTVGRDMIYQLFTNYILTFIMFTRQLTDAQLAAITGIMIFARIFDAANDPIMGNIIDRTRTRWGKFKPWLVIGILSTSVVVYLAFNVKLTGWSFIWFFGVIYILYSITFTMHDISYWGMIPSLGTDAHVRDQFTSRATLFAGIGSTLATILIPMLTLGSGAIGGSTQSAYSVISLIFCILAPLFLCFTIFGVHEDRSYESEPTPPISFKKILSVFKNNDQLLWIGLIFLLQQIGQNIILGGIGSTYIYFEFGYEGSYYSLFSTIGLMATAVLMVVYPSLSKRINRKPLMVKMMIISSIGYGVMLLAGLLLPANMIKFWIMTLGFMAGNFGNYSFYLISMISILNTVEYNEYKNGERDDAIIASVRPFLTKLASAIVVGITSLTYIIFDVNDFTNLISDLETQASTGLITEAEKLTQIEGILGGISKGQTLGLLIILTVGTYVFMLAAHLLYKKKYALDEEKYAEICEELSKR